jgi:hypothetical protein
LCGAGGGHGHHHQGVGAVWLYNKNAYTDIIIRSNHYLQAAAKARSIMKSHPPCEKFAGSLQIVTQTGVCCIGAACAGVTFALVNNVPSLNSPDSSTYIYDPMMVSFVAFCLGGMIAFGFMNLIDHTADSLLYCYAWSKRFKRETVDRYVPEDLREIVGFEDKNPDEYGYYGRADPNMYLGTWMATKPDPNKDKRAQGMKASADQRSLMASRNPMDNSARGYGYENTGGYNASGYGGPGSPGGYGQSQMR